MICFTIVSELKLRKFLGKNQNILWRNWSTNFQILTVSWIIKRIHAKTLKATQLFVDFSKAFDSIHRSIMEQILLAYGLQQKKTVTAKMMLYKDMTTMVRSPDSDTDCIDIVAGGLEPFLFLICVDNLLWTSLHLIKKTSQTKKDKKLLLMESTWMI